MEQALRAVERLVEDQRARLEELQRGHAQLEQALSSVRASKSQALPENPMYRDSAAEPSAPPRRRTPPPRAVQQTPAETDDASLTSSRTPRSQRAEIKEENARMARSNTEPKAFKSFRDDPRYKETGKEYGEWPPYPEWQDMPLRKFGAGFGKKTVAHDGAHIKPGGKLETDRFGVMTQHEDNQLVDGIVRGIGHGRRKFGNCHSDHFDGGFIPMGGKDEFGRYIDADEDIGHGKHHFFVKDHLNDESSTQASSSRGSRHSRRESAYTAGSSRSSRPRSAR